MASEALTALIDDLIREKTFSLEAVDAIKALRDKAKALEDGLYVSRTDLEKERGKVTTLESEKSAWKARESAVASRDAAVAEREKKITELEKSSAVAAAKSEIWSDAFHTIFKNTVVRRNVSSNVPLMASGSSYPTTASGSEFSEVEAS